MSEIDFLPSQYREQHTQRKNQAWRVVVVVAFAALCAAGMYAQRAHRQRLESKLVFTRAKYDQALQRMDELQKLNSELTSLRAEASLVNYLRRPWPRTRILSAVLEPVPESVLLMEVQIHYLAGERSGFVRERPSRQTRRGKEEGPEPHPALEDLEQFRREGDLQQCVVSISGWARQHFHLHDYLDQISQRDLVQRVELLDVETSDLGQEDDERVRFSARVTVIPAYGQPGGPQLDKPPATTVSNTAATGLPVLVEYSSRLAPAHRNPKRQRGMSWSAPSLTLRVLISKVSPLLHHHFRVLPGSRCGFQWRTPS